MKESKEKIHNGRKMISIGSQDFAKIITNNYFYIDKTHFIKEWWENGDDVTLITKPRRFGKTLNLSMLDYFLSNSYEASSDLFKDLWIWKDSHYRKLQGSYPVLKLSFADIKERTFQDTRKQIYKKLEEVYNKFQFILEKDFYNEKERQDYHGIHRNMTQQDATTSLQKLSDYLFRYYGKKVIILLDEYDTPLQEAYVNGYWEEISAFMRSFFNSTFKTNPSLERALFTGITRVSKESIFSDLNNIQVITSTSNRYTTSFGFTEDEVFQALEEYDLIHQKEMVKYWYDGFIFGKTTDIYNPWSILNFLKEQVIASYWVNSSSNDLVSKLLQESDEEMKQKFEVLLNGGTIQTTLEEQVVYQYLEEKPNAVWGLLVAGGYLKILDYEQPVTNNSKYTLKITNQEVFSMFESMVIGWFQKTMTYYHHFIKAMVECDLDTMNEYMNEVTLEVFSMFDTGKRASKRAEPERFYHGFVLGMMVDLYNDYIITSNRESGVGRYDLLLEPRKKHLPAVIMEFKVKKKEHTLEEAVKNALIQIHEKKYDTVLLQRGIPKEKIYKYGIAFDGKKVLIGSNENIRLPS